MIYRSFFLFVTLSVACSCAINDGSDDLLNDDSKELTIFFVNDQHGQLENFAKIKYIVAEERQKTNVILACSGDIFSGNPVVDSHPQKGYPIIDVMNSTGFDISVLGNHEFYYGEDILSERVKQAEFEWVCANVDVSKTDIPAIDAYSTTTIDDMNITFLGLVETNGKEGATIPSTHPWKVKNLTFKRPETVLPQYVSLKEEEDADLLIALTHLGHAGAMGDFQLAAQYPFIDLIIGGHSHYQIDTLVNTIPIFQADSYLRYLGKIEQKLKIKPLNPTTIT